MTSDNLLSLRLTFGRQGGCCGYSRISIVMGLDARIGESPLSFILPSGSILLFPPIPPLPLPPATRITAHSFWCSLNIIRKISCSISSILTITDGSTIDLPGQFHAQNPVLLSQPPPRKTRMEPSSSPNKSTHHCQTLPARSVIPSSVSLLGRRRLSFKSRRSHLY